MPSNYITPRFKSLIESANPEQKEALKTSKTYSDTTGYNYKEEMKQKYDPIWAIDLGVKESEVNKEFRWAYERFARHPEMVKLLQTLENQYFTVTFPEVAKKDSLEMEKNQ